LSPRRPELAGFTLLECLVAVIVLSLLAVGLARLTTHHDKLMAGVEQWTFGDPTYFVAQPEDGLQRLVGVPATLVGSPPLPPAPLPGPGVLQVTVSSVELELHPPQATALVHVEDV
jgi:prepilin-type N-terminal cleavage/methylation domain-containing protein